MIQPPSETEKLFQIIYDNRIPKTGVFFYTMPTGYGKTYGAFHFMARLPSRKEGGPRCIFITPQLKNLKEEELTQALIDTGNWEKKSVLRVKNWLECWEGTLYPEGNWKDLDKAPKDLETAVKEFSKRPVPGQKKPPKYTVEECFQKAVNAILTYERVRHSSSVDADYIQSKRETAEKEERRFRKTLRNHFFALYSDLPEPVLEQEKQKPEEQRRTKEELIRENRRLALTGPLHWIADLYPPVLAQDYDILLMSSKKFALSFGDFLSREKRPLFELNDYFEGDTVLLVDEAPEVKKEWLDELTQRKNQMDVPELFRTVHAHIFDNQNKDKVYPNWNHEGKYDQNLNAQFFENTRNLYEKYGTLPLKARNEVLPQLFQDSRQARILQSKKRSSDKGWNELTVTERRDNRTIQTKTVTKEDKKKKKKDYDYTLREFIRDLYAWERRLDHFVLRQAKHYQKYWHNSDRNGNREKRNRARQDLDLSQAATSILRVLGINCQGPDSNGQQILQSILAISPKTYRSTPTAEYSRSVYANGFRLTSLDNDLENNEYTEVRSYQVPYLPEEILQEVSQKSLVYLISATAEYPSSLSNFSLNFLRQECHYVYPPEEYLKIQTEFFSKKEKEFQKSHETEHIGILPEKVSGSPAQVTWIDPALSKQGWTSEPIWSSDDLEAQLKEQLAGEKDYWQDRCLQLAETFTLFFENPWNIQSAVAFTPNGWNIKAKRNLLMSLFRLAISESSRLPQKYQEIEDRKQRISQMEQDEFVESYVTFAERSQTFDIRLKQAKSRWSVGKPNLLLCSYKTAGNGVNFNHPDPQNPGQTKDIDMLYLDYPTNALSSLPEKGENSDTQNQTSAFLLYAAQVEELYEDGELTRQEANQDLSHFWNQYLNGKASRKTEAFEYAVTETIDQAIGRMMRGANKNSDLCLLLNAKLLETFQYSLLNTQNFSTGPMFRQVLTACQNYLLSTGTETQDTESKPSCWKELKIIHLKNEDVIRYNRLLRQQIWNPDDLENPVLPKTEEELQALSPEEQRTVRAKIQQRKKDIQRYDALRNPELYFRYGFVNSLAEIEQSELTEPDKRIVKKNILGKLPEAFIRENRIWYALGRSQKEDGEEDWEESSPDWEPTINLEETDAAYLRGMDCSRNSRVRFVTFDDHYDHFDLAMLLPDIREYFEAHHWPTSGQWTTRYVPVPKAAETRKALLGELAGQIFFQAQLGITLTPMRGINTFEFFDFIWEKQPELAIDMKNWSLSSGTRFPDQQQLNEIGKKAKKAGKKKIILANFYDPDEKKHQFGSQNLNYEDWNYQLLRIPSLIEYQEVAQTVSWNSKAIDKIEEFLYYD